MSELIDRYAERRRQGGIRPATIRLWTRQLSLFERESGPLDQASQEDIVSWLDSRRLPDGMPISDKTRATYLVAFRGFYAWAFEIGELEHNPAAAIPTPRFDQAATTQPISDADIEKAIAASKREVRPMLIFGAFEGLAPQEIAYLEKEDFDLTANVLHVRHGKGATERAVPLHDQALAALSEMPIQHGRLFPTATATSVSQRVNRHLHHLGIEATAASVALWLGWQEWLESPEYRRTNEVVKSQGPLVGPGALANDSSTSGPTAGVMVARGVVAEALASYDPDAHEPDILKCEEQRQKLLAVFPSNAWSAMTLERYALGQVDHPDNFCRWMEFVTTQLGSIKGGNARKHLIYYRAATGDWWYETDKYASVDEAWEAVRQGFVDAIACAEAGDWEAIESISALHSGPALLNKTLSAYFPNEVLPINSQGHLRHFLRRLGEPRADDPSLGTTTLNRLLLEDLRSCDQLDGWTTKQMERLLYTTSLSPFAVTLGTGPIPDVSAFIAGTLVEATDARLEVRREAEDEARKLLDDFAGRMTEEQARNLLGLFNIDYEHGRRAHNRFSPAFVGQMVNGLVANLQVLNSWTERIWRRSVDDATSATRELLSDRKALPSAGSSYPTMLMYLRDPERSAVWLNATGVGLERLTTYKPMKSTWPAAPDDYGHFCDAAAQLMVDYEIPPELLDYVLAAASRSVLEAPTQSESERVWIFQANPTIYDIDHALSELTDMPWVVRQYKEEVRKGDRVYLWRAGPDAGIVAAASVLTDPAVLPGESDDPFLLQKEALSKPELRVMLRIDSVLPSVVRRSDLISDSVLKDLGVIKFANATNFKVTAEQENALRGYFAGFRIPPLRPGLEEEVHLPLEWLREVLDLLTEKGQVVFYGPPGTGKTFVALALAEDITRDGGELRIVQFHPSYSYEDFVGGFRPVEDDGGMGVRYQRRNGPLRELAAAAVADPSHPYVLIVDEINRGNIPKIFGELLFLLEYRKTAVRLQYWPEGEFTLPSNLYLIGTMNTADRSIALVDAALRRRFYFIPFAPTTPPVNEVLDKWLAANGHGDEPARLLDLLNEEIAQDEIAIGPSYFMTDADGGPNLERIWQRAIMPLLEEYYYGTDWEPAKFSLTRLRAKRVGQVLTDESGDSPAPQGPG